jgi:hypothetical protein
MTYNTKNYTEQGGEKTVIGGSLEIKEGASVTGLPSSQISLATETTIGGIKAASKTETDTVLAKIGSDGKLYVQTYPVAANQVESTAEDVSTLLVDFNALLTKLKAAGLMEADE